MMTVRCYLAPSRIEGLGVYTSVAIPRGTEVWRYNSDFDLSYPIAKIAAAPDHIREFMDRYTYVNPFDPSQVILDADEARFMNHSDTPNVDFSSDISGRALRDIAVDEELTCDYACFTVGEISFQPPRHKTNGSATTEFPGHLTMQSADGPGRPPA
tara:strand:- start:1207 stop:1674 length:468 start_codon:yes stop_codon:yes gene_type:complete